MWLSPLLKLFGWTAEAKIPHLTIQEESVWSHGEKGSALLWQILASYTQCWSFSRNFAVMCVTKHLSTLPRNCLMSHTQQGKESKLIHSLYCCYCHSWDCFILLRSVSVQLLDSAPRTELIKSHSQTLLFLWGFFRYCSNYFLSI